MATKSCTGNARVWLLATLAGLAVTPVAMADKAVGSPSRTVGIDRVGIAQLSRADVALAPNQETISFSDRVDCTSNACIGSVLPNATAPGVPHQGQTSAMWSDFGNAVPVNPQQNLDSRVVNNFTPNANGTISELCWVGRYTAYLLGANPAQASPVPAFGVLPPASRTFRISYYNDAGGFPCAAPFAQFVVGATNPTAGTAFTQVGPLSTNATLNATHRFSAQHPAVAVTANSCVWVEIIDIDISPSVTINGTAGYSRTFRWICTFDAATNATAGPNTRPVDDRFFFGLFNPGTADGVPYAADEEDIGDGDPMFCVNLASIVTSGQGTCPNISTAAPANDDIGARQALTINAPAASGTLFGASQELGGVRPCGIVMGDGTGVWYSVTGNGQTLTVNTDFANNCTDTEIIVYDGSAYTGNANDLRCIGDSDDASATLGSTVEFCSQAGTQYIIYVAGAFNGGGWAEGNFQIQVTSSGACTPASPNLNCDVVASGTDELEQNEACGGGVDVNGDCGGNPDVFFPGSITIGGPAKVGSVETVFQTSRDRDAYNFTTAGAAELSVTLTSEFPALLFLIECTGTPPTIDDPNAEQIFGILVPTCITEEIVQVLVPRAGNWIFFVMPSKFGGLEDCALNFNQYRLSASIAPVGACCTGDACSIAQELGCGNNNGRFLGDGILCTPNECDPPCTITLGTPAEAESCLLDPTTSVNDSCASNAGTLAAGTPVYGTLSTASTVDGNFRDLDAWAFTQAATGDVAITLEAESNVLFQVINCLDESVVANSTTELARCTATATTLTALPAGNYIVIVTTQDFGGAPCTSGVNNYKLTVGGGGAQTPCQIADFNNDNSVTADDIFAFLDAWFAQNGSTGPGFSADVNSDNAVTADDIFAYLDLWFAQNGQTCP